MPVTPHAVAFRVSVTWTLLVVDLAFNIRIQGVSLSPTSYKPALLHMHDAFGSCESPCVCLYGTSGMEVDTGRTVAKAL